MFKRIFYPLYVTLLYFALISRYDKLMISMAYATVIPHTTSYFQNFKPDLGSKQPLITNTPHYPTQPNNLWDVLRYEFQLNHYEQHPAVQAKINEYIQNQGSLNKAISRSAPYLYYIFQQIKNHHLPAELVLLPIIESGYNPLVYSQAGAAGLWQIMPKTASGLGIKQNKWYDGRRDIIASTHAALTYFVYLQNFFDGNWLLALAAYNTGEGNVLAAIKHNIRHKQNIDFWALPVAQQTKDYVPSLLALATIISHPQDYPIHLPLVPNAPYIAQVAIHKQMSLKQAAHLAGIHYNKIVQLNPGFKKALITIHHSNKLVLPIENMTQFIQHTTHLHLASTAKHRIPPSTQPYPFSPENTILAHFLKNILDHYALQPGDTIYTVRPHDSLYKIAHQFHISIPLLSIVNQLHHQILQPGRQLIIPAQT